MDRTENNSLAHIFGMPIYINDILPTYNFKGPVILKSLSCIPESYRESFNREMIALFGGSMEREILISSYPTKSIFCNRQNYEVLRKAANQTK